MARLTKKKRAELQAKIDEMIPPATQPQLPAPVAEEPQEMPLHERNGKPAHPWSARMRREAVYPESGVAMAQTDDYKAAGLQFHEDRKPDDEEKAELQARHFGYHPAPRKAWLKPATPDSREEAAQFAKDLDRRRRENTEVGWER